MTSATAPLILASTSKARAEMLRNAGLVCETVPPRVDEVAAKSALVAEGTTPRNLADALAELKAVKVSSRRPDALVLGADQVLEFEGRALDKPDTHAAARAGLEAFSGKTHRLFSAAVIAENGRPVFRTCESVTLHVRRLSTGFLDEYFAQSDDGLLDCVGGYRLESRGVQLFDRIDGDYFAVLGLPLIAILGYLRERGHLTA